MASNVLCRYCGNRFEKDEIDINYIKNGNLYYHKDCYQKKQNEETDREKIHNYCKELFGSSYSKKKIDLQIKKMLDDGKSLKGIYTTLHYWYEVKDGDVEKANGGIGIVDYVYEECQQWFNQKYKNMKLNAGVDFELMLPKEQTFITVHRQPIKKPKRVNLFDIH